jgi:hypothetical protein
MLDAWLELKQQRDEIDARLTDLSVAIAAEYDHPDDGTKTHRVDGYKVTVSGRINRTINDELWYSIRQGVPKSLWPVRDKLSVDAKGVKYLKDKHPETWAIVATAITERPGKPGVKVEREVDA